MCSVTIYVSDTLIDTLIVGDTVAMTSITIFMERLIHYNS